MLAKTPIFDQFLDYCRQRGEDEFDHSDPYNCALAQFGKSREDTDTTIVAGYHSYSIKNKEGRVIGVVPVINASDDGLGFGIKQGLGHRLTYCKTFQQVFNAMKGFAGQVVDFEEATIHCAATVNEVERQVELELF